MTPRLTSTGKPGGVGMQFLFFYLFAEIFRVYCYANLILWCSFEAHVPEASLHLRLVSPAWGTASAPPGDTYVCRVNENLCKLVYSRD